MKHIRILSLCVLAIVLLLFADSSDIKKTTAEFGTNISLKPPSFVGRADAHANSQTFDIGEKLDAEAGISAYYQTAGSIDLDLVRGQFRTIEVETTDYIIGSVPVPGQEEHYDVHFYIHTSGWLLAYYMNDEPTSKIVEPSVKTIATTKFTTVLSTLAGAAGHAFTGETYYDFRYPNATNMLFVAEDEDNGNEFSIILPSTYGYFERSWAAYDTEDEVDFYVDEVNLWGTATWQGSVLAYGYITVAQLLPDTEHTFRVEDNGDDVYAVLVLTYRVP